MALTTVAVPESRSLSRSHLRMRLIGGLWLTARGCIPHSVVTLLLPDTATAASLSEAGRKVSRMSTPSFQSAESVCSGEVFEPQQLEISLLDLDLVEKISNQALIDSGYFTDEDGLPKADEKQLKQAVVQAMLDRHVVSSQKDMASRGVTKFELYSELLPTGPGVTELTDSAEQEAAKTKLVNKVWGYTNTGTTGHVQSNIPNTGYVVVEAKVARTKVNQETGKKEPTTEMARFLTGDKDLIMAHLTNPAGAKFVAQARKLENLLGMVTERRPELAVPIARQLNVVVRQAVASIPHADTKHAAALTAGSATPAVASDE